MECPFCREHMHDEATICPHCRKEHPTASSARSRRRWKNVGVAAAVLIGGFIVVMIAGEAIGNDPHAFDGQNQKAYEAARLYAAPITDSDTDVLVFDISKHIDVSHSEAEDVVVSCMQVHMSDTTSCEKFASVAKGLARLKRDGVIN